MRTFVSLPIQGQFIQFSKTLYSLFHGDAEEESLYRAVASVTSLLLRMEEVGRRLQGPPPPTDTAAAHREHTAVPDTASDMLPAPCAPETVVQPQEVEWSFSFEQILASLLNEPVVVNFFEKPVDIRARLEHAKVTQLKV